MSEHNKMLILLILLVGMTGFIALLMILKCRKDRLAAKARNKRRQEQRDGIANSGRQQFEYKPFIDSAGCIGVDNISSGGSNLPFSDEEGRRSTRSTERWGRHVHCERCHARWAESGIAVREGVANRCRANNQGLGAETDEGSRHID